MFNFFKKKTKIDVQLRDDAETVKKYAKEVQDFFTKTNQGIVAAAAALTDLEKLEIGMETNSVNIAQLSQNIGVMMATISALAVKIQALEGQFSLNNIKFKKKDMV